MDIQKDFDISCNAQWVSGETGFDYGIIWGAADGSNAYSFGISKGGSYIYGRWISGVWQTLIPWTKITSINISGINELKVAKRGSLLGFYINGTQVNQYPVFNFFGDYSGFHITDKQKVLFDDFKASYFERQDSENGSIVADVKTGNEVQQGYKEKENIFYDSFNDNNSKWKETYDDSLVQKVEGGNYFLDCKRTAGLLATQTVKIDKQDDFMISSFSTWLGGVNNNGYGLVWGFGDNINYYNFIISANGYYSYSRVRMGKYESLIPWKTSSYVNPEGENQIDIVKNGTNLEFYINGNKVNEYPFTYFFGDKVGFVIYRNQKVTFGELNVAYVENAEPGYFGKIYGFNPVTKGNENKPQNAVTQNDGFSSKLPPILSIMDIVLSKNLLNAGESARLSVTLKNIGSGDANGVYLNLASDFKGIQFPARTSFPLISKNGGTQTVNIDIKGDLELPTAEAVLKIEAVEPNFKIKIQGKQVKFPTREFMKPELILAKFAVIENLSASPNNQIDINEQIDVKFAVQNVGQGIAENVNINVTNNQPGVMLLGVVDNSGNLIRKNPSFNSINAGKFETITYRYFINSEFTGSQLAFSIASNERYGKFGITQTKSVEINKTLQEEGFIRSVNSNTEPERGQVVIEDIPDFASDVDQNIPSNSVVNDKTFAVVIGNENYIKEVKVNYALNDARIFRQYLQKTLGLPGNNIHYTENATFGQILDALKWINDVIKAYNGQAKVIFYYAGHGMPDEQTKSAYILPVDGNSQNTATAVKINDIYERLTEFSSAYVTVILDACFSGSTRAANETMLAQGRGVKIIPKSEPLKGNLVVFTAATGDQTALPYSDKQHGMLTYFLLKKLQDTKGNATLSEISNYVSVNVSQQSVVVNRKSQTPQVISSPDFENTWQTLKLK